MSPGQIIGLVVGAFVVAGIIWAIVEEMAKREYARALDALRADPHNAHLKQRALAAGRWLAQVKTFGKPKSTHGAIFSETHIANDINAATAGSGHKLYTGDKHRPAESQSGASGAPDAHAKSVKDRLDRLNHLLREGAITRQEYSQRRSKIIEEL